jgi:integrase
MRISDATFAERACLIDGNIDYYVIKTRRQITLPPELQQPALDALAKLPASRTYFFQPDVDGDYSEARMVLRGAADGEFSTLMPGYETKIRETTALVLKVLALAGLEGACHRFRDTFALNLLIGDGEKGTDIFTVSQMLGHSDVKITQEHYMKLIPGYRERMSKSTRVLAYQFGGILNITTGSGAVHRAPLSGDA